MAFLLDNILLAPVKGVAFIARKVQDAAMEELLDEGGVRQALRELYRQLDTGDISEEEFEEQEEALVERLEEIEVYKGKRQEAE